MHYDISRVFHFLKNKELNELYASIAIRSFAISLIGIFIPIYLYQIGYSFSAIFLFFALAAFFKALLIFPSAKVSYKIGLKHSMLLSMPFLIIFFVLMFSLERFNWPLWFVTIFLGIHTALFWFSYHTDFSKFSKKKFRGKQVGASKIVVAISSVLGPIAGGIILSFFGFKVLFVLVSFLLIASTFPLFMSKEVHEPINFSLKGFFKTHKIKNVLAYMGNGIEARIGTILWPLFAFIFILGEKYVSLGALSSVALTFSVLSTFIISKFSDLNLKKLIRFGSVANSIVWFAKSFVVTPVQLFIADAFYGASATSMYISFDALAYNKVDERNRTNMIIQREVYISLGGALFLFIIASFTDQLISIFRYGGPLSSLMQFFF